MHRAHPACAEIASPREGAWVTSFAIIGSYQIEISPPSYTPVSLRTRDAVAAAFGRRPICHKAAGRGQEIAVGILGIDPGLDRPAGQRHVLLPDRKRFARRNPDHLLDEIDAGDEFGHRMLDLQPRVHLEEIEAPVLPRDEFDGAGAVVTHGLGECDRLLAHPAAGRRIEQRRGRLFHDLLIAALDRAFALAEMNDIAVLVAQYLDFDVPRVLDEFLDEYAVVAERRFRLGARTGKAFRDLGGVARDRADPCRRRRRKP